MLFLRSGVIEINVDNVQLLLSGSTMLHIERLRAACSRFLHSQLDSGNCIGIRDFASMYSCEQLESHANQCLNQHFLEVLKCDEFLHLKYEKLHKLLNSDSIQVQSEEDVFIALENWLHYDYEKRKQFLPELLKCVRVPLLSLEFLQFKVFSAPFIKSDTKCQLILARVMNERPESLPEYLCTPRALPQSVYIIGGRNSTYRQLNSIERYDYHQNCWNQEIRYMMTIVE